MAEGNTLYITLKDETIVTCRLSTISVFHNDLNELVKEQKDKGIISEYNYPPEWQAPWWASFLPYLLVMILFVVIWSFAMNIDNFCKMG